MRNVQVMSLGSTISLHACAFLVASVMTHVSAASAKTGSSCETAPPPRSSHTSKPTALLQVAHTEMLDRLDESEHARALSERAILSGRASSMDRGVDFKNKDKKVQPDPPSGGDADGVKVDSPSNDTVEVNASDFPSPAPASKSSLPSTVAASSTTSVAATTFGAISTEGSATTSLAASLSTPTSLAASMSTPFATNVVATTSADDTTATTTAQAPAPTTSVGAASAAATSASEAAVTTAVGTAVGTTVPVGASAADETTASVIATTTVGGATPDATTAAAATGTLIAGAASADKTTSAAVLASTTPVPKF